MIKYCCSLWAFKVLCLIKSGIKSRLWPSSLMTNYWQLAQRMASLRPFFSLILFSQSAPFHTQSRLFFYWHRNATLNQKCHKIELLYVLCANACVCTEGLQVWSWRVLKQIPAEDHTLPTCVVYLILREWEGNYLSRDWHWACFNAARTSHSNSTNHIL